MAVEHRMAGTDVFDTLSPLISHHCNSPFDSDFM